MPPNFAPRSARDAWLLSTRPLSVALVILLAAGCLIVLRPFFSPIIWAGILAYATWPAYRLVGRAFRDHAGMAAFAMTVLALAIAVLPLFWLLVLVAHELAVAVRGLVQFLAAGPHALPPRLAGLPVVGSLLQQALDRYAGTPDAFGRSAAELLQGWSGELIGALASLGRNVGKILIGILTLFFFYRDGAALVGRLARLRSRYGGERLDASVAAAGQIIRAVLYGFVLTVLAQGVIAGIGYWILGVDAPALLGALTGLAAPIPVLGTGMVWVPVAASLLLSGHTWQGIVMLLWGALLVHPVDNILRPLVISNVGRLPFMLVMFGVLGGVAAFGLVGVFIGPVLLGLGARLCDECTNVEPMATAGAGAPPAAAPEDPERVSRT